jgi:hypothetical protein
MSYVNWIVQSVHDGEMQSRLDREVKWQNTTNWSSHSPTLVHKVSLYDSEVNVQHRYRWTDLLHGHSQFLNANRTSTLAILGCKQMKKAGVHSSKALLLPTQHKHTWMFSGKCFETELLASVRLWSVHSPISIYIYIYIYIYINSSVLNPQVNYTDWSTATCWRNLVPTFADRGVSRGQRGGSPTVVNLSVLDRSRYLSFK